MTGVQTCALPIFDTLVGDLADFLEARGVEVLIVSEYAITAVDRAVPLNRVLREHDWLELKPEDGSETLDVFNSKAFAVVDHQVAHVVVLDPAIREEVRKVLLATPGVAQVLDADAQAAAGLAHPRSGDFVVVADARSWFSYYWWEEGRGEPDYARTVDIHRKPGYDPVKLFIDPRIRFPLLKVAWFLLRKALGFKALMEVVSLDASLVKGSHGRVPEDPLDWPVLIAAREAGLPVIVHTRDADEMMGDILEDEYAKGPFKILLHCYTSGADLARRGAALGAWFSVSGIATFKAAQDVRDVIAQMPADKIIIETDCPYLAPVPMRGRRNEPAFLPHILAKLAEIRDWSLEEAESRTEAAFFDLFHTIPRPGQPLASE